MNAEPVHRALARRDFLKFGVFAGIASATGCGLFAYAPWLDYDERAALPRSPLTPRATPAGRMRGIVRYASLAASGHNTQPWKFSLRDGAIAIRPDFTRRLPIVDPTDRELWISVGCALENLLVAARALGLAPEATYPGVDDAVHVRLTGDTPVGGPAFDAIPLRQNTRSQYDGRPIANDDIDRLKTVPLEPGVRVHYSLGPAELETVVDYVRQGNLEQYADGAFLKELVHWVRFNKREAMASLDGLYSCSSGNPEVPRWLGQIVVSGTSPRQQADADTRKLRSSSGAFVVASESDDRTAWVRTGQVYERIALTMTSLNIRSAFHNQPVEVASVRSRLQAALGLGTARPQLLVRFGHADPMPRSLRRPVEQLLT